jgi:hypothetical protein
LPKLPIYPLLLDSEHRASVLTLATPPLALTNRLWFVETDCHSILGAEGE